MELPQISSEEDGPQNRAWKAWPRARLTLHLERCYGPWRSFPNRCIWYETRLRHWGVPPKTMLSHGLARLSSHVLRHKHWIFDINVHRTLNCWPSSCVTGRTTRYWKLQMWGQAADEISKDTIMQPRDEISKLFDGLCLESYVASGVGILRQINILAAFKSQLEDVQKLRSNLLFFVWRTKKSWAQEQFDINFNSRSISNKMHEVSCFWLPQTMSHKGEEQE